MNAPISSFDPFALVETSAAQVRVASPCGRLSLRARGDLAPLNAALGLTLPEKIGQRVSAGNLEAICLGPDEWKLETETGAVAGIEEACAKVYAELPHALVDISAREATFVIEGVRPAELLTLGCPRDIATIEVGTGRRTVFDGATVLIWRDGESSFRMDVWNSFAPHLFALLDTGCRELAAEAA